MKLSFRRTLLMIISTIFLISGCNDFHGSLKVENGRNDIHTHHTFGNKTFEKYYDAKIVQDEKPLLKEEHYKTGACFKNYDDFVNYVNEVNKESIIYKQMIDQFSKDNFKTKKLILSAQINLKQNRESIGLIGMYVENNDLCTVLGLFRSAYAREEGVAYYGICAFFVDNPVLYNFVTVLYNYTGMYYPEGRLLSYNNEK